MLAASAMYPSFRAQLQCKTLSIHISMGEMRFYYFAVKYFRGQHLIKCRNRLHFISRSSPVGILAYQSSLTRAGCQKIIGRDQVDIVVCPRLYGQ